jgi:2-C-methyl-D-erythritol 4-phosphate cytidylyltransferase
MSVFALIPAAGSGKRFGSATKKQYLELYGQPVLAHTIRLFNQSPFVDAIFLIAPSGEIEYCRQELVERFGFHKVRDVVCGGEERQVSVYNGLTACGAQPEDIILIHDGVRPFFPGALLGAVIHKAEEAGACLVAVPARDTLKEVEDGRVVGTPERKRFWQAQTPQAFRFDIILQAHQKALDQGFRGTDDASLVERMGVEIPVVEGSFLNLKITTQEDLTLAVALGALLDKEAGLCE